MAIYPFYNELKTAANNMNNGNFGLWFNKFVPLSNNFKASNADGTEGNAVEHYFQKSSILIKNASELLAKKHADQVGFISAMKTLGYTEFVINAKLASPLITGIGETHPNEVGMAFDHTMGIPYISASSVKGLVRFAASLNEIFDENGNVKKDFEDRDTIDDKELEGIREMFGYSEKTDSARGKVIFLDAYPTKIPTLKIDIMNPHYGDYYSEKKDSRCNLIPPADYLSPVPIKFLTVAPGTEFVFRALIGSGVSQYADKVASAYTKALTEEGVGAKTAIGYGRFSELKKGEPEEIKKIQIAQEEEKQRMIEEEKKAKKAEALANMSPADQDCFKLKNATEQETMVTFQKLGNYPEVEDKKKVAIALKERWIVLGKWEGKQSDKQKLKIVAIKEIIGDH